MKAKKILAVLMTAAVLMGTVAGSTATTFAAAPVGEITINVPDGLTEDVKLNYVQIITEDTSSPQGWKFKNDTVKNAFVSAWLNLEEGTEVTPQHVETVINALFGIVEKNDEGDDVSINKNVLAGEIHSSAELSRALAAVETDTVITDGKLDPTDMGLYMITVSKEGYSFSPMTVYVGPDFESMTVTAKGSKDQIGKEPGAESKTVMSGEMLDYTVTARYPYYPSNAEETKFIISDTIENAKIDIDSVKVTIGGSEVNSGYTITPSPSGETDPEKHLYNDTMKIEFTSYEWTKAGDEVKVTYNAKVDDIDGDVDIKVKNNAKAETEKGYTIAKTVSDSATFTIIKTGDENKLLSGAEFTLYVADEEKGDKTITYVDENDKSSEIRVRVVETKATEDADDPTTNFEETEGKVTFFGLDPNETYYVEETKAPEGYVKLDTIWLLSGAEAETGTPVKTFDGEDSEGIPYTEYTTTTTVKEDYTDQPVVNTRLSALPSTGGIGTTIFTVAGCLIMVAAAGMFFVSRRKESK